MISAPQLSVRSVARVHVAEDHVGAVAGLPDRVGSAVNADQDRSYVADVSAKRPQVPLVVRSADHDQHVAVAEVGLRVGQLETAAEDFALGLDMADRVLGKCRKSVLDLALLSLELKVKIRLQLLDSGRDRRFPIRLTSGPTSSSTLPVGKEFEQIRRRGSRPGGPPLRPGSAGRDSGTGHRRTARC